MKRSTVVERFVMPPKPAQVTALPKVTSPLVPLTLRPPVVMKAAPLKVNAPPVTRTALKLVFASRSFELMPPGPGKTSVSPATGAMPPCQFAGLDQLGLPPPPDQVRVTGGVTRFVTVSVMSFPSPPV